MEENMNQIAEIMGDNALSQPLMSFIEQIMNLPDNLDDTVIESLQGMIQGSITSRMRIEAANSVKQTFENNNYTRRTAQDYVNQVKTDMQDMIESLQPSNAKRVLLQSLFDTIYEITDNAIANYHQYDFDMNISLEEGAKIPTYAHDTDAAADLYAKEDITIPANSISNMINTGVHIQLPENWMAIVIPRSSIGAKTGLRLSNSQGCIDPDYRGAICVLYDNISDSDYTIHAGDRIAQLLVRPVYRFNPIEVTELTETERGEGGFGSSGK